eukprot:1393954-Amorphochlora_amoeboformis.AAC.1
MPVTIPLLPVGVYQCILGPRVTRKGVGSTDREMRASDLILAAAVMLGAYESFKALEAKSDERVAGLLQFWVVIAVLQMVEPIFDTTFSW